MKRSARILASLLVLLIATACTPTWNHTTGLQTLSASHAAMAPEQGGLAAHAAGTEPAGRVFDSRAVSFVVPAGWHWYDRGDDLIATKDGVFLQHLFIERIHVTQTDQAVMGAFPLAAFSTKQWPTRTARSLKKRFTTGMSPADAAEVLLESRRNDPGIADFQVRKVVTRTVAGNQAFRVVFDFRLKKSAVDPSPLYRSVYCGFMHDDWFYGISYTAAARYYFDRDAGTFEAFLESFRLMER